MLQTVDKEIKLTNDCVIDIAEGHYTKDVNKNGKAIVFDKTLKYSDLVNKISKPKIGEKASNLSFIGGKMKPKVTDSENNILRIKENLVDRSLITLDIDGVPEGLEVWENVETFSNFSAAMYSTHNSTPGDPRYRLIVPLKQRISVREYEPVARFIADLLQVDVDESCYRVVQVMHYPTCRDINHYEFYYRDSPLFDMKDIPNSSLKQFKEVSSFTGREFKKRDPRTKENWIGAFCSNYSITDILEGGLTEVYRKFRNNRYTYINGTSEGGLVIYDNDTHAHSNHSTDPISGMNVNSFDLYRLHKYRHLDSNSKPNTPVNKLPSYLRMIEVCKQDEQVKDYYMQHIKPKRTKVNETVINDKSNIWIKKLEITDKGLYKNSRYNIKLILENDEKLKNIGRINEFSGHREVFHKPFWRKETDKNLLWSDIDEAQLRNYYSLSYGIEHPNRIKDVIDEMFYNNSYHPVREYLKHLKWDEEKRVETYFIDYLGADDTLYTRTVTRKMLVAAVARVMEPGIKFDNALIVIGRQGAGKSHVLSRLGGEWFNESVNSFKGDEALMKLRDSWIIELAELSAMRTSEVEEVKGFISAKEDTYRPKFGKNIMKFPRQCVFFGSTNNYEFLKDQSGNRRFWPVSINNNKRMKNPYEELTDEVINQVWAEAVQLYENGEKLYLDNEQVAEEAEQIQKDHTSDDGLAGVIESYIDGLERVCARQIWFSCLGKINEPQRHNISDINAILRTFDGWEEGRANFGNHGRQRGFIRIK